MKITSIAFGLGLLLAASPISPSPAWAQKIILIKTGTVAVILKSVRVRKFGRVTHKRPFRKPGIPRLRFTSISVPGQTLFPPYYRRPRPWAVGPDMTGRIEGGRTVLQGSRSRSHIKGGKTVQRGAVTRSHIKGGRTVEGGSRWAGHLAAGRTVEWGSPWASRLR